ncbi:class I SAM-dependent methyltransferase [Pseudonocardia bannensis]|uniref:Class I SAM-dependent methyltransferase n=1 Tax=Pseudonocardia bannensis TaxID=630973 RepID=A0A848DEB6_9PSEU|nr:class I SAM-dependent methyltransferase [Pseudonocardia bannensis]NMH90915.1 class I SAM-dependent methyltransferase [Pseudonocardia bannensis]
MRRTVSERLRWVSETVAAGPDARLLEVGSGHGVVVSLVAARLTTGRITGLDRSPAMTAMAMRANAEHIAAGRAELRTGSLEEQRATDLPTGGFDTVFAARVAAFWTRPEAMLPVTRRLLAPGGQLLLFLDAPVGSTCARAVEQARAGLDRFGFTVHDVLTGGTRPAPAVCIAAGTARAGTRLEAPVDQASRS